MKRLIFLAACLLGFVQVLIKPPMITQAADRVQVTIRHSLDQEASAPVAFDVYDLTAVVQEATARGETLAQLEQRVGAEDDQAVREFVASHHLRRVVSVTTDTTGSGQFTLNRDQGQTFLVVRAAAASGEATTIQALPLIFSLTPDLKSKELVLITKAVSQQRGIYFYKYAQEAKKPLAGAVFTLSRADGRYRYRDGTWRQGQHEGVMTVSSDQQGLVLFSGLGLPAGRYVIEEIKAPAGYQITQVARHIAVTMPPSGGDQAITVNGEALRPLLAGRVQADEWQRTKLRVTNPLKPATATVTPPQWRRPLPQTGEAKLSIALLGIMIIGMTVGIWKRKHQEGELNNHEK